MNILSLFDGASCGRLALDRSAHKVQSYYSSEIDGNAVKVASDNWPENIHLGDVQGVNYQMLPKIDLLIGGSPCQGFSSSGKGLNFSDPRSALFFEFLSAIKEVEPKYFILENVGMKKEWVDVISDLLGVEPISINSKLVSAQNRVRNYWTNIPGVTQPDDKGILLTDILESDEMPNKASIIGRRLNSEGKRDDYNKSVPITQCLEVRPSNRDKSNCLTTVAKDNVLTSLSIGRHKGAYTNSLPYRNYTVKECCRLQTMPDDYFKSVSDNQARKMLGNGWTVDVIAHILSFIPPKQLRTL